MGCGRVGSSLARSLEERDHTTAVIDSNAEAFRRLGPTYGGLTVTGMGFDRELFGVTNVVARIYDAGRAEVYERLGIPTVATVPWAADQVLRRLLPAGSEPQWRDPSGELRLDSVYAPFGWIGRPIAELEDAAGVRVAFVTRLGSGVVPKATMAIQEGDYLSVFMRDDRAEAAHAVLTSGPDAGTEDH